MDRRSGDYCAPDHELLFEAVAGNEQQLHEIRPLLFDAVVKKTPRSMFIVGGAADRVSTVVDCLGTDAFTQMAAPVLLQLHYTEYDFIMRLAVEHVPAVFGIATWRPRESSVRLARSLASTVDVVVTASTGNLITRFCDSPAGRDRRLRAADGKRRGHSRSAIGAQSAARAAIGPHVSA